MEEGKKNEQPDKRYTVFFSAKCTTFEEAASAFRNVTGAVALLSRSLVGNSPRWKDAGERFFSHAWLKSSHERLDRIVGPFKTPGEYSKLHKDMRQFSDEKGLEQFVKYLLALVEDAEIGDKVSVRAIDRTPIYYEGEAATVWIGISKNDSKEYPWKVLGGAIFKNPKVPCRVLKSKGFMVNAVTPTT